MAINEIATWQSGEGPELRLISEIATWQSDEGPKLKKRTFVCGGKHRDQKVDQHNVGNDEVNASK